MLVLSRKQNGKIVIGEGPDAVVITVVEIDRNKVRIGVTASPSIKVDREEVRQAIEASQQATPQQ